MLVLRGLKFFPTCFALLNGKTYSTGNVVPVRAKTSISFELDKADICISVPSIPISIFVEVVEAGVCAWAVAVVVRKKRPRMLVKEEVSVVHV